MYVYAGTANARTTAKRSNAIANNAIKDVIAVIMAWWITFTLVATFIIIYLGFGSAGVVAGMRTLFPSGPPLLCQAWY